MQGFYYRKHLWEEMEKELEKAGRAIDCMQVWLQVKEGGKENLRGGLFVQFKEGLERTMKSPRSKVCCQRSPVSPRSSFALVPCHTHSWQVCLWCKCSHRFQSTVCLYVCIVLPFTTLLSSDTFSQFTTGKTVSSWATTFCQGLSLFHLPREYHPIFLPCGGKASPKSLSYHLISQTTPDFTCVNPGAHLKADTKNGLNMKGFYSEKCLF